MRIILISLLVAILLIPSALAIKIEFVDKVLSMEHNEDTICQDGEFPIVNKECNLTWTEINNFNFFQFGWFYKLLIFGMIILIYKYKYILKDNNFLILTALIIFLLIAFPNLIIEKNINKNIQSNITITQLNETQPLNDTTTPRLEIPKSSIDNTWDTMLNFPKTISKRPYIGDIIFWLLVLIGLALFPSTLDFIEKKVLGRK